MSQIVTLYSDKEKTNALYPRTKVSGISDDNNTSLQELLKPIDNLTSSSTDKALSANQGRLLGANKLSIFDTAAFHNSIVRGNDITSYYTDGTL